MACSPSSVGFAVTLDGTLCWHRSVGRDREVLALVRLCTVETSSNCLSLRALTGVHITCCVHTWLRMQSSQILATLMLLA